MEYSSSSPTPGFDGTYDDGMGNSSHVNMNGSRGRRPSGSGPFRSSSAATPDPPRRASKQDNEPLFFDDNNGMMQDGNETPPRRRSESPPFTPPRTSPRSKTCRPTYSARASSSSSSPERRGRGMSDAAPSARAKSMKRSMPMLNGTTAAIPNKRKFAAEEDPENLLIKRLRTEEHLNWKEIAAQINELRESQGKPATCTEAAAYGKFVRNAPLIARFEGVQDFDPKDYMHLRPKKPILQYEPQTMFNEGLDEILVRAVQEVSEEFWVTVSTRMERLTGRMIPHGDLLNRWHML